MKLNIFIIFIGLFFTLYILDKVRKKSFSERESLIWLFVGIIILIFSLFPVIEFKMSTYLGISYGPTLLFLMGFVGVALILLRKEEQLTKLNDKIKELGQRNSLLEEKIRKIDQKLSVKSKDEKGL